MKAEQLRINPERLLARLNRLAEIGRTEDGSCCRLALTDEDRAGRDLVGAWMRELGLEVRIDAFVPSIKGISHNPAEDTQPVHLAAGADVLLHTLLELAS